MRTYGSGPRLTQRASTIGTLVSTPVLGLRRHHGGAPCRGGKTHLSRDGDHGGRMLITRDSTNPITDRAIIVWTAISPLTRWVRGMVSVGLNATTLVNAT